MPRGGIVNTVLILARALLAATFLVAGIAKLLDLRGSRQAMADFGVPKVLAGPAGNLLPVAELAIAVALIPTGSAQIAAVGAVALLVSFSLAIAVSLARGKEPECNCFGQVHSAPVGGWTLAR